MADDQPREREGIGNTGDPSALTTAQILHEIGLLKEYFNIQLSGEMKAIDARIAAIDRATEVFSASITRVPTETQKAVSGLEALHNEKFAGIQTHLDGMMRLKEEQFHSIQQQFQERDVRTESSSRDAKVAVDAALQAAKEAVAEQNRSSALAIAKSEAATGKTIDGQALLIATATKALDDKIAEIRERLTRIEGQALGKMNEKSETHTNSSFIVSVIGILIAISSLAIAAFMRSH